MSEFVANFHFLRPWWLLLLVLLPLIAWWLLHNRQGRAELARLADASMLPLLLAPGRRGVALPLGLLVLSWLLASLALAGPAWERLPLPLHAQGQARVIALSLSDRMLATDAQPNRLIRARFKIRDLLDAARGDQNALVAYAGAAFQVAPLTPDVDTLLNLIDTLEPSLMPVPGDATAEAIELGVGLLRQAGVRGGEVILVTSSAGDNALDAARAAHAVGVQVSVLAVGTRDGAPVVLAPGEFLKDARGNIELARLESDTLRAVAAAGGGIYQTMRTDAGDVTALATSAGKASHWKLDGNAGQAMTSRWRDRGPWLLLALLPIAALGFRRGWLLLLPLVLLFPSPPAQAGIWDELWYNADQQAARALADGKPAEAQELAQSPGWRGIAAYRAGEYAKAAESFAQVSGADASYNRGNSLAREGKYQAAIEAYNKALDLHPDHADALANCEAVKEWLKQQQQKEQQDSQQNSQPKQGDSKSRQQQGNKGQQGEQDGDKQDQGQQNPQAGDNHESGSSSTQSKPDSEQGKSPAQDSAASTQNPSQGDEPEESRSGADPENAQRDEQQAAQARQDFSKQMDQALQAQQAKTGDGGEKPAAKGYVLGAADANDKLDMPTSMQRALERVPDDPGGLLRRKFLLEHQRRQQGGGE